MAGQITPIHFLTKHEVLALIGANPDAAFSTDIGPYSENSLTCDGALTRVEECNSSQFCVLSHNTNDFTISQIQPTDDFSQITNDTPVILVDRSGKYCQEIQTKKNILKMGCHIAGVATAAAVFFTSLFPLATLVGGSVSQVCVLFVDNLPE